MMFHNKQQSICIICITTSRLDLGGAGQNNRTVMEHNKVGVKNVLKGRIQRAWLQLVRCAPYPSMCP